MACVMATTLCPPPNRPNPAGQRREASPQAMPSSTLERAGNGSDGVRVSWPPPHHHHHPCHAMPSPMFGFGR
jgi:hypothetical protein